MRFKNKEMPKEAKESKKRKTPVPRKPAKKTPEPAKKKVKTEAKKKKKTPVTHKKNPQEDVEIDLTLPSDGEDEEDDEPNEYDVTDGFVVPDDCYD